MDQKSETIELSVSSFKKLMKRLEKMGYSFESPWLEPIDFSKNDVYGGCLRYSYNQKEPVFVTIFKSKPNIINIKHKFSEHSDAFINNMHCRIEKTVKGEEVFNFLKNEKS